MYDYQQLVQKVLSFGESRADRTGVGTISLFGEQLKFDMRDGFPAVTTKHLAFKQVAGELAAFLRGYRTLEEFHSLGVKIWDANGNADYWKPKTPGDLGRIYGVQWRQFYGLGGCVDQLKVLVEELVKNPSSRRHIVTAWQPAELDSMCLPPCHILFQCYVSDDKQWLDLRVDMRSVDVFLGLPFDIASYALLLHLLAKSCGYKPRKLVFQLGDTHIYKNHVQQCYELLSRTPYPAPILALDINADVFAFNPDMAKLLDYEHHPKINAEMAV